MKRTLMCAEDMNLPTLEAVCDQLVTEMEEKTAKIKDLDFDWVDKTTTNNKQIIALLKIIKNIQQDTMLSHV